MEHYRARDRATYQVRLPWKMHAAALKVLGGARHGPERPCMTAQQHAPT